MKKRASQGPRPKGGVIKIAGEFTNYSTSELERQKKLFDLASALMPMYGPNWHRHSQVTMRVGALSRALYYNYLYQKIVDVPGVVCEFGVQWGATLTELIHLRSIYEPFNYSRTIIGFDTFEGFPNVDAKDGGFSSVGDYSSAKGYEHTLETILELHESFAPLPHIKKFQLVKGDASSTIDTWLANNPHAIVSMAIFDMDVYQPTKDVLQKIIPRLTKGSVLVFDELNCSFFPGETRALDEVIGINKLALKRSPLQPFGAWATFGE